MKKTKFNKYECNMNQELLTELPAGYMQWMLCVHYQMTTSSILPEMVYWQVGLYCLKWCIGLHLENVTTSRKSDCDNRCLFTCRSKLQNYFHPDDSIWKDRTLGVYEDGCPNKKNNNRNKKNKMSSDIGSVPDQISRRLCQKFRLKYTAGAQKVRFFIFFRTMFKIISV